MTPILLAQLELGAPARLIVLVLLPALVWLALRRGRAQPAWQKTTSISLRCAVFVLLCLAWAAPALRTARERMFVAFAIDRSASCQGDPQQKVAALVNDAVQAHGDHAARYIWFDSEPRRVANDFADNAQDAMANAPAATDIAAAVALAQAACPPDRVAKVVLLSDGRQTRGDLLAAAAGSRVPISVAPLEAFSAPEIAIDAVDAPGRSAPGEPVDVAVTILANHHDTINVQLERDGATVAKQQIDVQTGRNLWRAKSSIGAGQSTVFRATFTGGRDAFMENNSLSAVVMRGASPRVLVVQRAGAANPATAAIEQMGLNVDSRAPDDCPTSTDELSPYRLVFLANLSAGDFTTVQLSALDGYVRGGGSLVVAGGEQTFAAAAYELTALEKMLPVVATDQPIEQQKSLALVLVIDKSKSMEEENRLGLAKEAAKKVADVLRPRDQVGVLAFGDEAEWISRLAPLANKDELLARIDSLTAAGLTNMVPALERAYLALSQADADSRHVILLTDGVPTPGDFDVLAGRMKRAGIRVSTVSLGPGADQTILQDISRIARGNHYHVDKPDQLPRILERETRDAASKVTPDEYAAETYRQLPGLSIDGAPLLTSYVATNFKPGAQLLLTAGEGDPLLAWWRYGRGKAMVLTTDAAALGQRWQNWPGNLAFWQRLARYVLRDQPDAGDVVSLSQRGGRITVTLNYEASADEGLGQLQDATATLEVLPLDGRDGSAARKFDLPQVAPGRFAVSFDAAPGEKLLLDLVLQSGARTLLQRRRGLVVDYPDEFRLRGTDERTLRLVAGATGGEYDPRPQDIFAPDGRTVDVLFPLWPYLLIVALLTYLADVAVRRVRVTQLESTIIQKRRAA